MPCSIAFSSALARGANKNQFAQLIVNFHDLVEARAALVAALVTRSAAFAVVNLGSLGLFGV